MEMKSILLNKRGTRAKRLLKYMQRDRIKDLLMS